LSDEKSHNTNTPTYYLKTPHITSLAFKKVLMDQLALGIFRVIRLFHPTQQFDLVTSALAAMFLLDAESRQLGGLESDLRRMWGVLVALMSVGCVLLLAQCARRPEMAARATVEPAPVAKAAPQRAPRRATHHEARRAAPQPACPPIGLGDTWPANDQAPATKPIVGRGC